jgi:hypothetical protein
MTTMVFASEFIDQTPTDELVPYKNNPRTHSATQLERLVNSLKEFGFTNPILIDEDNNVIAGHGRLQAAIIAGFKTVPTITLDHLTPEQRRAYVIADNQLALNSGWDDELLQAELKALSDAGFDTTLLGWGENLPTFGDDIDLSALDDFDDDDPTTELADGVMKAIQIEFRPEDYDEAKALVDAARKRGDYVGMKLIEALA